MAYIHVALNLFSLDQLSQVLATFQSAAEITKSREWVDSKDDRVIQDFISCYRSGTESKVTKDFALQLRQIWKPIDTRTASMSAWPLLLAIEYRQIMLCNASAWSWLTFDCPEHIKEYLKQLEADPYCLDDTLDWLPALVRDVRASMLERKSAALFAYDYIDPDMDETMKLRIARDPPKPDVFNDTLIKRVVKAARHWLSFPSDTEMLQGLFAHGICKTFHTTDVLFLPGVWDIYNNVRRSLNLGGGGVRSDQLTLRHLDPFMDAIAALPLASPTTPESDTVRRISLVMRDMHSHLNIQSVSTERVEDTTSLPGAPGAAEIKPELVQAGWDALLAFIRDLMPVLSKPSPSAPTPLQALVMDRPNHYSPFRERAPARQLVTSPGGPFHKDMCDQVGAFASAAIFRGVLFDAPVLQQDTSGYFADLKEWKELVQHCSKDRDHLDLCRHMFRINCYGTAQSQRKTVFKEKMHVYFDMEKNWNALVKHYNNQPIPFPVFCAWARNTKSVAIPNFKPTEHHMPLYGPLTAFLLAGDLSYTNQVAAPTPMEVGHAIAKLGLGSLAGLIALKQIPAKGWSPTQIAEAFVDVFKMLDDNLDKEEKNIMGFDVLMVEHLLCKYQRLMKRLPSAFPA